MRKFIAYLATSADGFIARPNGAVEWLDRPPVPGNYGMSQFYRSVDTVVMGRKTWEVGRRLGQLSYPGKANYVFSRSRRTLPGPGLTLVHGSVASFAKGLRRSPGRDVWIVGGAELFGAFLDAGELDELIVHVVPTLIGKGIPLLSPRRRRVELRLKSMRRYSDGVVRLHYEVPRGAARKPARRKAHR